jgi:UDP-N-acetylglucosamine diphosphorylase/glucosamine-1-phosphate N-acetyltransferase
MQAVVLEDVARGGFGPMTALRPEFDLRCGILKLREKLELRRPDWRVALLPRPSLADLVAEGCPGRDLGLLDDGSTLALCGRVIVDDDLLSAVETLSGETLLTSGGEVLGALLEADAPGRLGASGAARVGLGAIGIARSVEVPARSVRYPWDLVAATASEIEADARLVGGMGELASELYSGVTTMASGAIAVDEACDIGPGVVLDARRGPVVIGRDVTIMPNAVIVGPASVGDGSIVRANAVIYGGTSIGPVCKVGGEVSGSVLQSYVNKQHGGYLGSSCVGSWVNLGAATNTSDLKNNYGNVRVRIDGKPVDTGFSSVGAIIGDHSKTAIGTRLNTGSVVGIFSSVVTAGFPPKHIPSFSWVTPDGIVRHDLDRALNTGRTMMGRRGVEMTEALERLIREVYDQTTSE